MEMEGRMGSGRKKGRVVEERKEGYSGRKEGTIVEVRNDIGRKEGRKEE